SATHSKGF
ncbi:uvrABC system A domain protein, partial [Vibrio parahaemolyticus V-223/04]